MLSQAKVGVVIRPHLFLSELIQAFALHENREKVTLAVLQMQEDEILRGLQKKWWYDKGECGKKAAKSKVRQLYKLCE